MHVTIIGGGISGLVIGYRLARRGFQVDVFEADDMLGGLAAPVEIGGGTVERAYHLTFKGDRHTINLIESLGLDEVLHWKPAALGIFHQGRIHPFSGIRDLLNFQPLGPIARLRMGLLVFLLSKTRSWHKLDGKRFSEWARRWAGDSVYEHVWEPLLRKKFGEQRDQIPVAWMWGKIRRRAHSRSSFSREEFGYLEGSFQVLYQRLAQEIEAAGGRVHLGTPINGIQFAENRVRSVEYSTGTLDTDLLVSAIPYPRLWHLLSNADDRIRAHLPDLPQLEYLGALCLIVSLDSSLMDQLWLNINDPDIPFVVVIEITHLIGTDDFHGRHIAYVARYLPSDSELFEESDESLFTNFSRGLEQVFPDYKEQQVTDYRVERHRYADPVPRLNFADQLPPLRTGIDNLYLTDFTRVYPYDKGSDRSIHLAEELAELILQAHDPMRNA